jgi:hypothetical protein
MSVVCGLCRRQRVVLVNLAVYTWRAYVLRSLRSCDRPTLAPARRGAHSWSKPSPQQSLVCPHRSPITNHR